MGALRKARIRSRLMSLECNRGFATRAQAASAMGPLTRTGSRGCEATGPGAPTEIGGFAERAVGGRLAVPLWLRDLQDDAGSFGFASGLRGLMKAGGGDSAVQNCRLLMRRREVLA